MSTELLEVEVVNAELVAEVLSVERIEQLTALTCRTAAIDSGHLAVEFIGAEEMQRRNREFRQIDKPTDVLSFPVDELGPAAGQRELGDVVICREHTEDLEEAVVHGVLHLLGMDHETDNGEMLEIQREVLEQAR